MNWTVLGIVVGIWILASVCIGFHRGFIKEAVSLLFVILAMVIVWFLNPYVSRFLEKNTPVYQKMDEGIHSFIEDQAGSTGIMSGAKQEEFLQELPLPGFLKDALEKNNKSTVYQTLGVDNFVDYLAEYLAKAALNTLSFVISFVLATVLIRLMAFVLNVFANLPVIKGMNKLAGAALGGARCVVFIWIAMLVISLLYQLEIGEKLLSMIQKDTVLSFLYEHNYLAKWITKL